MKVTIRNEMLPVVILSIITVIVCFFSNFKTAKVILGFPFILLFPGYTLTALLFPKAGDLRSLERLVFSFGLSITVVPMLCMALNYTPWGIRLYSVVLTVLLFISVMAGLAWKRRIGLPKDERLQLCFEITISWSKLTKGQKILYVSLLGAVFLLMGTFCYVVSNPKGSENFTEFYILGQGGMAADYPKEMDLGEEDEVTVGIVNHENKKINYRMEVRMGDEVIQIISPITLKHGEKWEQPVIFRPNASGENVKVEFALFKEGQGEKEPYRKLHLWMDVKGYD
ncbi:MAG: DUF1616 domain-containing protein [Clostridia bacterium]|nr:DUF1616 domain-containing protein [Clostridia bacterium]